MTSGRRFVQLSFCHFFLADFVSLKTTDIAVFRLRQPSILRVRLRTVAKMLSIGLVVLMYFQRAARDHEYGSGQSVLRIDLDHEPDRGRGAHLDGRAQ